MEVQSVRPAEPARGAGSGTSLDGPHYWAQEGP